MSIWATIKQAITRALSSLKMSARWVTRSVWEGGRMVRRDVLEYSLEKVDQAFDAVDTVVEKVGAGVKAVPGLAWQGVKATPGALWEGTKWTATRGIPGAAVGVAKAGLWTAAAPVKAAAAVLEPVARLFRSGGDSGAAAMAQELAAQRAEKEASKAKEKEKQAEQASDMRHIAVATQKAAVLMAAGKDMPKSSVPEKVGFWLRSLDEDELQAVATGKLSQLKRHLEAPGSNGLVGVSPFLGDEQIDPALVKMVQSMRAKAQAVQADRVHREEVKAAAERPLPVDWSKLTQQQRLELRGAMTGEEVTPIKKTRRPLPIADQE